MRFVKHPQSLSVKQVNEKLLTDAKTCEQQQHRHGVLLPSSIRCIICGPSNCGKTNVMISLLEDINGLKFENVYVYCKSLFQPKYEYLKKLLQPIKGINYFEYDNREDIMHPSKARKNSIFIFDDVACDKQSIIRDYFSMGRHKLIDSFYLCQSYTHIPKHLIRDNSNFLIIFKQDELNLKHIYNDHVSPDVSFQQFCEICRLSWQNNYDFLVISKDNQIDNGRYRKGFDNYIML